MKLIQRIMNSPVGPLYLVASHQGLKGLYWEKQKISAEGSLHANEILDDTVNQLKEYFEGKRQNFDLKLDLDGTAFQMATWNELRKIPFGTTKTYMEIATKVGNAKAVRAVGTANGKNPVCIIIPCHRVVGSNGNLTGYSGELDIKEKLITFERLKNSLI